MIAYGALPELWWSAQDHCGHPRIGGDRADSHALGTASAGAGTRRLSAGCLMAAWRPRLHGYARHGSPL